MDNLRIKGPRQQRAIAALLEGPIAIKDIGFKIGALNPRQIISELRRQGFLEIIKTRRLTIIDRDGKQCRPGEYYISDEKKPMVRKTLKECDVQARARCSEITKKLDKPHNNREE